MNKIIPIALIITAVIGLAVSIMAIILVVSSFAVSALAFAAVLTLVVACIITVFPLAGGIFFKGKICKAALVISCIAYLIIIVGFIVLYSV